MRPTSVAQRTASAHVAIKGTQGTTSPASAELGRALPFLAARRDTISLSISPDLVAVNQSATEIDVATAAHACLTSADPASLGWTSPTPLNSSDLPSNRA